MRAPFSQARRLARNLSGTVAVEFAFIMPIMLVMFLGCMETTNVVMTYMRLNAAVQTAVDLVAQTPNGVTLTAANVVDLGTAAQDIMAPLPGTNLTIAFASVVWDATNTPQITTATGGWHQEVNAAPAIVNPTTVAQQICKINGNIVAGLCASGDSIVIAQVTYRYNSPFAWLLPVTFNFTDIAFSRPRFNPYVKHV
jgi:Flp pilus assembly protein TadG